MKRVALVLLVLASASLADDKRGPSRNSYANPSAVIAAELAFAQAAQDKGQWTAFAEAAAPDAVMFTPQMVYAQAWLKGRANPAVAVKWQPHEIWSSCDGSLMVSHGAWQGPRRTGYFTTLWQRQRNGAYKWIYDGGDTLAEPLAAPEMISAQIADCPARTRRPPAAEARSGRGNPRETYRPIPFDPAHRSGQSDDGTLRWTVTVGPGGARNLSVEWKKDGADKPALTEQVSAEGQ